MSVAYYIIVNDDVEFNTFVNGKVLAQCAEQLNQFCISHALHAPDFYLHDDVSDFVADDFGLAESIEVDDELASFDDIDLDNNEFDDDALDHNSADENTFSNHADAPEQDEVWFDPEQGIAWVEELSKKLQAEEPSFLSKELLVELQEYKEVFIKTHKAGAMWHLAMDY